MTNECKVRKLTKYNYRPDNNFHLYYDTETSPVYFIQEENQKIEDAKIITLEEYKKFQEQNNLKKKLVNKIGSYQITKMISVIDELGNINVLILDDENNYYKGDADYYKNEDDLKSGFWQLIDLYIQQGIDNIRIFAHNAKFDIKQVGFFSNKNILINLDKKKGGACLSSPFFIRIIYKNTNISFEDSMNFFRSSLRKLGEDIGLKKLDYEFEFNQNALIIDDDTVKYCIRDTEIIKKAIEDFRNYINENQLGKLGLTIAGTAFSIYSTSFNPGTIIFNDKKNIVLNELNSYNGGRTEAFKLGLYKNIFYYDVNSLYPYTMYNHLPCKYDYTLKEKLGYDIEDREIRHILDSSLLYGIYHVEIETNEPNIPLFHEGKLMFVNGKLEKIIHEPEFKYFYNQSDKYKIKVNKIDVYRASKIFKKYVDFWKEKKINAKNKTEKQLAKNMLNNLYGKFGQRFRDSEIFMLDELEVGSTQVIEDGNFYDVDCFGFFALKTYIDKNDKSEYAFPAIAGSITSYARVELLKSIDMLGKENILYCDTDSIMTIKKLPLSFIHDKEFGKWKVEKENINVIIKGCKSYILFNDKNEVQEIKCKGIKKTSIELEENLYLQKKFWSIKTSKVKKETLFTLEHTVIMDEYKDNKKSFYKYSKRRQTNNYDISKIKLTFKKEISDGTFEIYEKDVSYLQSDLIPYFITDEMLLRENREMEKFEIDEIIYLKRCKIKTSGQWKNEIKFIPNTFKNNKTGVEIDVAIQEFNEIYGKNHTVDSFIEEITNYYSTKKTKKYNAILDNEIDIIDLPV